MLMMMMMMVITITQKLVLNWFQKFKNPKETFSCKFKQFTDQS